MSFGWMGVARQGSWKALRSFALQERRDIGRRLAVIRAELRRIGSITVIYRQEVDENTDDVRVTEERVGFSVSKNSNLEKLVQAYVANGGNPLDVSQFFLPDRAVAISENSEGASTTGEEYPLGGVLYPKTAEPNEPENSFGAFSGGFIPLRKYIPGRIGSRRDTDSDSEAFVNFMMYLRKPINHEIRRKRNDIEARIVKQCDLREQLMRERDEILVQAFGGLVESSVGFDPDRYAQVLRVPRITQRMDELFFFVDSEGVIDFEITNTSSVSSYDYLLEDILPDEANTAL